MIKKLGDIFRRYKRLPTEVEIQGSFGIIPQKTKQPHSGAYLAQTPGAQCSLSLKIQPPLQPTPTGQHPHLPNQVTPNLEPLQHPPDEPQPQTLQPHITTMETQHSTPSDTDDMMQENPAAPRGRHFDPHREPTIQKPARWNEMSKTQRRHWLRHRLQTK